MFPYFLSVIRKAAVRIQNKEAAFGILLDESTPRSDTGEPGC